MQDMASKWVAVGYLVADQKLIQVSPLLPTHEEADLALLAWVGANTSRTDIDRCDVIEVRMTF